MFFLKSLTEEKGTQFKYENFLSCDEANNYFEKADHSGSVIEFMASDLAGFYLNQLRIATDSHVHFRLLIIEYSINVHTHKSPFGIKLRSNLLNVRKYSVSFDKFL